jgi:transcriptional regulator with XRE-family HTH domain
MRSKEKLIRLKKWLLDLCERQGLTQEGIAKECGVSQSLVSRTIRGSRKNQAVVDFFLSKGCPKDLLD